MKKGGSRQGGSLRRSVESGREPLLSRTDGNIVNIPSIQNAKKARATISDKPAPPDLKSCFFKQFFQVI